MRRGRLFALVALALAAGLGLVVLESFRTGRVPPRLVDALMSSRIGRGLAERWIEAVAAPAPPGTHVLRRGDTVPELRLPDPDGRLQALSQWRGKPVLLNFWATWCAPCREEMPALAAAQRRYGERVQVVGIAMDDPVAVRDYLHRRPAGYPVLIGQAARPDPALLFGDTAGALPFSVLIGADGRIEGVRLGKLDPRQIDWWLN